MVVVLVNKFTGIVNVPFIRNQAQAILQNIGAQSWRLGIILLPNQEMLELNLEYRSKNKPTDILSFPFHENINPRGVLPEVSHPEFQNLGDIFIAPAYVEEQMKSPEFGGISVEERLPRLLTHGVCHLLGYDHEVDEDYEVMLKRENQILESIDCSGDNVELVGDASVHVADSKGPSSIGRVGRRSRRRPARKSD